MDNGSNKFWEATYRQNIGKMIGVCCRYTQNRATAEDLAHDAFLVAIDKASSFENKGPFEAWLRRIVVNVALQYLRKQKYLEQGSLYIPVHEEETEGNPDNEQDAFSEAELLEVISYLPEHHRIVFNLYVIDHFTHAQIAAELGISEGTSKSHLARARKKIRELLTEKIRKNKERKRILPFFLFPYQTWNVDRTFAKKLHNFTIPPQKELMLDAADISGASIPKYPSSTVSHAVYLKTGIWVVSTAIIFGGITEVQVNSKRTIEANTDQLPDPVQERVVVLNSFSYPKSATIPDNPIIVDETKNVAQMKTVSTLGGLLMAGLVLDSVNLSKDLSDRIKIQTFEVHPNQQVTPKSGTFYASKVYWSETNHKLFFLGDHVRVDVDRNKFNGSGKFTFLKEIHYLVVDQVPVKPNETIKLADKKYSLIQLDESEGVKKYGDNGKFGVIEIMLAE